MRMHARICNAVVANVHCACLTFHYTRDQVVDDFAVAQSTPLPECIAGFEGDKVRRPSFAANLHSAPLCFLCPLRSHLLRVSPRPPSYTGW